MAKNAYEIRLDVLKIASDMIAANASIQERAILSQSESLGRETITRMSNVGYNSDTIVEKAEELLSFVNNSTR